MTNQRAHALVVLMAVCNRSANPAEHADIENWIAARSLAEGGFLWLAGHLSVRPSVLARWVYSMLNATRREHTTMQRNLETAQKRYGD